MAIISLILSHPLGSILLLLLVAAVSFGGQDRSKKALSAGY